MDEQQSKIILAAITSFKDWSNFLLVTTTGALGWVSTTKGILDKIAYRICLALFAGSIIFGIATLSMIPIITERYATLGIVPRAAAPGQVAEDLATPATKKNKLSFYSVLPEFTFPFESVGWLNNFFYIKGVCLPQHLLFLAGIIVYAWSAKHKEEGKPTSPVVFQSTSEQVETAIKHAEEQMRKSTIDEARNVAIEATRTELRSSWLKVIVLVVAISAVVQFLFIWLKT